MISRILIYVSDLKYIDDYRKAGIDAFLFALDGYAVGYKTYSIEEINKIDVSNKYVLLNRILDNKDIDKLKDILPKLNIKGLIFEDLGVLMLCKKLNLNRELILFQNHFNTNSMSVNSYLKRVDSLFLSNELTRDELKVITDKVSKPVIINLYGYNQVMYSRRKLLSNWSKYFNVPYKNSNIIEDTATKVRFRAIENDYGTVMYSDKIFNGRELLNLNNIKYFYINTMMIDNKIIMDFLKGIDNKELEDNGFLDKKTIFKLKVRDK